jgi:single-strand DNA-binding protein
MSEYVNPSMNKVFIEGRLTREPEIHETKSGGSMAIFSVAITITSKKTAFIKCISFGAIAEALAQAHLAKGTLLVVTGHLETSAYEKQGQKITATQVLVHEVMVPADSRTVTNSERPGQQVDDGPDDDLPPGI